MSSVAADGSHRHPSGPPASAAAAAGGVADTPLQAQNAHLQVALDNMRQGLTLFDAAERLIFCNTQYLRMHGLSPDVVRPGCSLRDVLEHRVRTATLFGDVDHIIERTRARVASGKTTRIIDEWVDGRVVAIEISPTGGGGWVASHDDITDHVRTVDQLRRTKNFLDTVIDHVPATIIVKDATSFRYVLINKNGEEYLGHSKDELIGRSAANCFRRKRSAPSLRRTNRRSPTRNSRSTSRRRCTIPSGRFSFRARSLSCAPPAASRNI